MFFFERMHGRLLLLQNLLFLFQQLDNLNKTCAAAARNGRSQLIAFGIFNLLQQSFQLFRAGFVQVVAALLFKMNELFLYQYFKNGRPGVEKCPIISFRKP